MTKPVWFCKVSRHSPEEADHTFAVWSRDAVSTCWSMAEKTAGWTRAESPFEVSKHYPEAADHTFAALSPEAVSTCWQSAEKTAK